LTKAGKDVTRKRVLDLATHLEERDNPFVYPGVVLRTSPAVRFPITQLITSKLTEAGWTPFGDLVDTRRLIETDKCGGPAGPCPPPGSTPTPKP
jgi:hypothetical protein